LKKNCEVCGKPFDAKRRTAKYCSNEHRVQAQRGAATGTATVVALGVAPAPPADSRRERESGPLESAARTELEAVGRAETLAGGVVLALARRIDQAGPDDTGSGFAALTKELRASLAAAVAGAEQSDEVDRVRKQREEKRRGRVG
jgi:hypothetical protein